MSINVGHATTKEQPDEQSPGDIDWAEFTVSRSGGDIHSPLTVNLHPWAGTATNGTDYVGEDGQALPTSVTIPAELSSVTIKLRGKADDLAEGDETVWGFLAASDGYLVSKDHKVAGPAVIKDEHLDLAVDSNNDGTIDSNDDKIEDDPTKPGKIVGINNDDSDADGIPGYADGFDWRTGDDSQTNHDTSAADDNASANDKFTKLVLTVPDGVDLTDARFELAYNGSTPGAYSPDGTGSDVTMSIASDGKTTYGLNTSTPGSLRVWRYDADHARDGGDAGSGSGDYFEPLDASGTGPVMYTADQLGLVAGHSVTLYIEGITTSQTKGDAEITATLIPDWHHPDDGTTSDSVRVTNVDVNVLIGADSPSDTSLHDDWISSSSSASEETIKNYVTLDGPAGLSLALTLSKQEGIGGLIDIVGEDSARRLALTASTTMPARFYIQNGLGITSLENDDVRVQATLGTNGPVLGLQTMTVVDFEMDPQAAGTSEVPLNPDRVNSYESSQYGNTFGVHLSNGSDHNTDNGPPTKPDIRDSHKIKPSDIEVIWQRSIYLNGDLVNDADSKEHPETIWVNPCNSGLQQTAVIDAPANKTNLRMRDVNFPAQYDDVNAVVKYRLLHPTAKSGDMTANDNYGAEIQVRTLKHWQFNV